MKRTVAIVMSSVVLSACAGFGQGPNLETNVKAYTDAVTSLSAAGDLQAAAYRDGRRRVILNGALNLSLAAAPVADLIDDTKMRADFAVLVCDPAAGTRFDQARLSALGSYGRALGKVSKAPEKTLGGAFGSFARKAPPGVSAPEAASVFRNKCLADVAELIDPEFAKALASQNESTLGDAVPVLSLIGAAYKFLVQASLLAEEKVRVDRAKTYVRQAEAASDVEARPSAMIAALKKSDATAQALCTTSRPKTPGGFDYETIERPIWPCLGRGKGLLTSWDRRLIYARWASANIAYARYAGARLAAYNYASAAATSTGQIDYYAKLEKQEQGVIEAIRAVDAQLDPPSLLDAVNDLETANSKLVDFANDKIKWSDAADAVANAAASAKALIEAYDAAKKAEYELK